MTPYAFFAKNLYNQWYFFSQILHTYVLNKYTHVDNFWCLISKYTEYDNILLTRVSNVAIKICNLMHIKCSFLENC